MFYGYLYFLFKHARLMQAPIVLQKREKKRRKKASATYLSIYTKTQSQKTE